MQADLKRGEGASGLRGAGRLAATLAGAPLIAMLTLCAPDQTLAACGAAGLPAGVHAAASGGGSVHAATSVAASSGGRRRRKPRLREWEQRLGPARSAGRGVRQGGRGGRPWGARRGEPRTDGANEDRERQRASAWR